MNGAVIYCRVSTEAQTKNLSLPTQRRSCVEYCENHGLKVLREFTDGGESAKTIDRPQFQSLLKFCHENAEAISTVVVYNLSRLSRNAEDYALLLVCFKQLRITVKSVTEPVSEGALGKLTGNMMTAFNQFDNDVKSERTTVGMRAAIDLGRWPFQAPIGYVTGGRGRPSLILDETRAPSIREAFEMFSSGRHSLNDVLRRLAARGLRTRAGRPMSPQTLGAVLRNEIYVGRIYVPSWNLRMTGDFEAIVSDYVFNRVQQLLLERGRGITPYQRNHKDFPLRRFVACAVCATPLTGSWSTSRGRRYAYYHCRGKQCRSVKVQKTVLENRFVELLKTLEPNRDYLRLFTAIVADVCKQTEADEVRLRKELAARLQDLRRRLQRVEDAFIQERRIDRRTFESQRDRLRGEIADAELALPQRALDPAGIRGTLAFAERALGNAARVWSQSELNEKQCFQKVLFPTGLAFDGEGFGNVTTGLIFNSLREISGAPSGLASLSTPSWNQIGPWLEQMRDLQRVLRLAA